MNKIKCLFVLRNKVMEILFESSYHLCNCSNLDQNNVIDHKVSVISALGNTKHFKIFSHDKCFDSILFFFILNYIL